MSRRVIAALALAITLIVVACVVALTLWSSGRNSALDAQMHDEADTVLALAAEGRYADVVGVLTASCPERTPQSVESLEFFFRGEPFGYRPTMARRSHTLGSVHYALENETYAHIVVVTFVRDADGAPWRPCRIAVAGYT